MHFANGRRRAYVAATACLSLLGCSQHVTGSPALREGRFQPIGPCDFALAGADGWHARVRDGALEFASQSDEAPLALRTTAIGRGVASPVAATDVRALDGVVRIEHGPAREELRADAHGIEQSWRFATRPMGDGPLIVRVATSGRRIAGRDPDGAVRFASVRTRGVRYGAATWIDARGVRTPVAIRAMDDALELVVASDVVEHASYPAVLDPAVTPMPVEMDSMSRYDIGTPAIAHGPTNFGVLWSSTDPVTAGLGLDIRGNGFTNTGLVVEAYASTSDPVRALHLDQDQPSIASLGTDRYIAVWRDASTGAAAARGGSMIQGAIYTPGTTAMVGASFYVADDQSAERRPVIACNNAIHRCFVAWEADLGAAPGISQIFSATLDVTSLPTSYGAAPGGSPLHASAMAQHAPAIAAAGGDVLIAWEEGAASTPRVFAYDFSDGSVSTFTPTVYLLGTGNAGAPRIASDGTNFDLVFEQRVTGGTTVVTSLIAPRGLGPTTAVMPIGTSPGPQTAPDVAFDGINYVVAWTLHASTATQIEWARVARTGTPIDPMPLRGPQMPIGPQDHVALAGEGAGLTGAIYQGSGHAWLAMLSEQPGACTTSSECPEGVCVGSQCVTGVDGGMRDASVRDVMIARDGEPPDGVVRDARVEPDGTVEPDITLVDDTTPVDETSPLVDAGESLDSDNVSPPTPGYGFHGGACACSAAPGSMHDSRGRMQAIVTVSLLLSACVRRRRRAA